MSADATFEKTPGWLDWYAGPSKPRFKLPPGAVDAHCHVFGPGARVPLRARAQVHALRRVARQQLFALRDHLGFARNVVVQATCHGADNRAMVDALPRSAAARRAAWPPSGAASRDARAAASCTTPACAACASTSSSAWSTSRRKDELMEIAARIAPLGWHVVDLLRGASTCPSCGTSSPRCRPPWWSTTWAGPTSTKPVDGPEFELFLKFMREHANVWTQGQLPRAAVGQRPAGAERRAQRLPRRGAVRAPRRRDLSRPRAVGHRLAAPEPEGPHARRRPAGRLHPAHRDHARAAAASCWSTTRCASTGPRKPEELMSLDKPYLDIPGTTIFDAEQSRKGY